MTLSIGLDAGYDPTWPAGFLYVRNLVRTLAALPPDGIPRVRLLPVTIDTIARLDDLVDYPFVSVAGGPTAALVRRRLIRRFVQPLLQRPLDRGFAGLDVTFPGFGRPIPTVAQVHWIPDFQHVHLPHFFDQQEIRARDRRFTWIASRPGVVVLSSKAAMDDFQARYPNAAAMPRVWRFHTELTEAERSAPDPRQRFGLPEVFLYVANQFWAHKEHLTLFKALTMLRERGSTPTVVCTGLMEDARNPTYVRNVVDFVNRNGLNPQVHFLGMLDRADQIAVMRHAAALIQPSRFEGWSTVVEDAKAVGRPILVSNLPVHREQAPEAEFFEVGSPSSLAEALERLLMNISPGPDPQAEAEAAQRAHLRARQAAQEFVDIMDEAVALGRDQ